MSKRIATILLSTVAISSCATPASDPVVQVSGMAAPSEQACAALINAGGWADPSMRIITANFIAAGKSVDAGFGMKTPPLPAHCEVSGILRARKGQDGQDYAIRFKMRLPLEWSQRFLFQGGGGTNGNVGEALGAPSPGAPTPLMQGYAIISQDSGHSNALNSRLESGGEVAFGLDYQARADYGHASLKASYDAARAIMTRFYGRDPKYSYFAGCSKGGQEGMAFAQRYPDAFDGVLAAAPGFSLPKAAIAEVWDTQAFAAAVRPTGGGPINPAQLASSFSDADLGLARDAVLAACMRTMASRMGLSVHSANARRPR